MRVLYVCLSAFLPTCKATYKLRFLLQKKAQYIWLYMSVDQEAAQKIRLEFYLNVVAQTT